MRNISTTSLESATDWQQLIAVLISNSYELSHIIQKIAFLSNESNINNQSITISKGLKFIQNRLIEHEHFLQDLEEAADSKKYNAENRYLNHNNIYGKSIIFSGFKLFEDNITINSFESMYFHVDIKILNSISSVIKYLLNTYPTDTSNNNSIENFINLCSNTIGALLFHFSEDTFVTFDKFIFSEEANLKHILRSLVFSRNLLSMITMRLSFAQHLNEIDKSKYPVIYSGLFLEQENNKIVELLLARIISLIDSSKESNVNLDINEHEINTMNNTIKAHKLLENVNKEEIISITSSIQTTTDNNANDIIKSLTVNNEQSLEEDHKINKKKFSSIITQQNLEEGIKLKITVTDNDISMAKAGYLLYTFGTAIEQISGVTTKIKDIKIGSIDIDAEIKSDGEDDDSKSAEKLGSIFDGLQEKLSSGDTVSLNNIQKQNIVEANHLRERSDRINQRKKEIEKSLFTPEVIIKNREELEDELLRLQVEEKKANITSIELKNDQTLIQNFKDIVDLMARGIVSNEEVKISVNGIELIHHRSNPGSKLDLLNTKK